ncbi:UNVERIFIED_CONTAM: hypothetical protein K2H54_037998 [Gekko kuhli]
MARRPLPDGSRRAEPTAAVPGAPGFALGGTLALPPPGCRTPLALPAGLNCALCPAAAGALPPRALYRCVRGPEPPRSRPGQAHGSPVALHSSPRRQPPAAAEEPAQQPNGHLLRSTAPLPSLEQALGARLRHMGDHFHREHQRRRQHQQQPPPRALWDHVCRFIFQLLGVFYNRPVEGGLALGPN